MKRTWVLLFSLLALPFAVIAENRPVGKSFATRSEILARHGMAATSQPLATQVALDILKQGGTAVDAAIAANAVLGLVEPMSNGIGGDLYAIVWDAKTKKLYGLNASGRSPYALELAEFEAQKLTAIPEHGPLSVSVPGCVDGWFELHKKFGKLPMTAILAPTIQYANEGFPVSEVVAAIWTDDKPTLTNQPGYATIYLPQGRAPKKGEIFRNPDLAKTLGQIAAGGRDAFYKGDIARTIDAYMKKNKGYLAYKDLADHTSDWIEPASVNYRGYDVWELGPNTQGYAVLQQLNILEEFDLKSLGFGSKEYLHLFIESKKLAFEDRAKFYADPAFNKIPLKGLLSKEYAASRRKLIDLKKAAKTYDAGNPALNEGDTIYMTVADKDGNMVSLIQSLYKGMGSGMVPDGTGFVLQNRGALFSLNKGEFNTYAPHKRPFHTIIPAFITKDGAPLISFGVMGGAMQPQGHVQIVVNFVDFGMNLQEAGDAPRVQHIGSSEPTGTVMKDGGEVLIEFGFSTEVERDLVRMGHKISRGLAETFGGYQAIKYDAVNKVYYGASESRKDGQAAGY